MNFFKLLYKLKKSFKEEKVVLIRKLYFIIRNKIKKIDYYMV